MTIEEFNQLKFHFESHMSLTDVHITTYATDDNRFAIIEYTPYDNGEPTRGGYRYYRIGAKVYKSKKKFLEALKDVKL